MMGEGLGHETLSRLALDRETVAGEALGGRYTRKFFMSEKDCSTRCPKSRCGPARTSRCRAGAVVEELAP
ncbi:hypothetical protein HAX54_044305 [Datura stramonium]|uniref:Uncharacterized protein n=1 Tax=Datura stramonium TaxID=4076 RepID=A0ABS8W4L7_DATST|nr:hypothetical protein [Datura stramonium]